MSDLEEGEVLDSESEELELKDSDGRGDVRPAVVPPNTPNIGSGPGPRLNGLDLTRATAGYLYRSNSHDGSSSEDDDSLDSDDDNYVSKRKKRSGKMPGASETILPAEFRNPLLERRQQRNASDSDQMEASEAPANIVGSENSYGNRCVGAQRQRESGKRRVNNVWGAIMDEQMLTNNLGGFGVEKNNDLEKESDRNVEFYDYTKREEDDRPYVEETDDVVVSNDPFEQVLEESSSQDMDTGERKEKLSNANFRKRVHDRIGRKNAKERLGRRTYNKNRSRDHIEATPDDSIPVVVNCIVNQLNEPNVDLMARIVQNVGKKRALELLYETEDIEQRGGMMTFDLKRRRTPGGVYIQLLKTDPDITKKDLNEIFENEIRENNMRNKKWKKAKRKRLAERQREALAQSEQILAEEGVTPCSADSPKEGSTVSDEQPLLTEENNNSDGELVETQMSRDMEL